MPPPPCDEAASSPSLLYLYTTTPFRFSFPPSFFARLLVLPSAALLRSRPDGPGRRPLGRGPRIPFPCCNCHKVFFDDMRIKAHVRRGGRPSRGPMEMHLTRSPTGPCGFRGPRQPPPSTPQTSWAGAPIGSLAGGAPPAPGKQTMGVPSARVSDSSRPRRRRSRTWAPPGRPIEGQGDVRWAQALGSRDGKLCLALGTRAGARLAEAIG